ncbi:hypothetical protein SacN8_06545 [Sulfolobus acidocaldarius N8]|uniref:Uncharacterized protein n=2 Tax=Sulfolobus acidocaldarius TaxID=2285 RepID=M1ID12_9CREN|nr:hypothetical protein SacN8_06545 [Sulfolobus acidocaldarius N8]AGE73543.1 hypothetical protein SacRon12I_06535 [Sulfolobus acidocaldarius Ron12/I]
MRLKSVLRSYPAETLVKIYLDKIEQEDGVVIPPFPHLLKFLHVKHGTSTIFSNFT